MRFLSDLDAQWRGETPDDVWLSTYLSTSAGHRKMIHEQMRLCQLTAREATQKIFKCDKLAAKHDKIPPRWNTPIIQRIAQREASRII
jgi:hypothetical protein